MKILVAVVRLIVLNVTRRSVGNAEEQKKVEEVLAVRKGTSEENVGRKGREERKRKAGY
jgi:hypothetical protein